MSLMHFFVADEGINFSIISCLSEASSTKIFSLKTINCFIKIKSLGLSVPALILERALSMSGRLDKKESIFFRQS